MTNEADAYLAICYQNRYNDSIRSAFKYLSCNQPGKLIGGRAFLTWDRDEDYYIRSSWRGRLGMEGGGVLINQAVHTLDLLALFMGRPVQVDASMQNHHLKTVIEVEDTMEAYITFENGDDTADAIFYATTANCQNSPPLIEVYYENYSIRIEGDGFYVREKCSDIWRMQDINMVMNNPVNSEPDSYQTKQKTDSKICDCSLELSIRRAYWGNSHNRAIRAFYRTIETGDENFMSIRSTDLSNRLMLGIYESARKGIVKRISD